MIVMSDVTKAAHIQTGAVKQSNIEKTSITPFQKVLQKEEDKVSEHSGTESAVSTKKTKKSESDSAVKEATEGGGGSTGKVSLKSIFKRASEKYNISYDFLVSVAKAESDFNTKCVSSAGAQGIMQIMPAECKELGVKDPFDAEQNIMAAARLLKAHLKKFDGDYTLAAAAYNAGSGTVKKYGGVPPYKETQNYVKKINQYMKEGVTVPNKTVSVKDTDKYTGSGGSTGVEEKKKTTFDQGQQADNDDWEQVVVAVGTGEDTVTMSYGAYLKYLELGTTGVG